MRSWQHSSAGVALLGAARGMLGHVWGHRGPKLAQGRGTGGVGSGWREQWLCTCPAPTHAPVGPATPGMRLAALPAQLRGRGRPGALPAPPAAPGPAQLPPARTQTPCLLLAPPAQIPGPPLQGASCVGTPQGQSPFASQRGTMHGDMGTLSAALLAPLPCRGGGKSHPRLLPAQAHPWHMGNPCTAPAASRHLCQSWT